MQTKVARLSLVLLFSVLSSGCGTLYVQSGVGESKNEEKQEGLKEDQSRWQHDWLFGFVTTSQPLAMYSLCPQGVERMRVQRSGAQVLFAVLTLGLYSPQEISWKCVTAKTVEPIVKPAEPTVSTSPQGTTLEQTEKTSSDKPKDPDSKSTEPEN